MTHAGLYIWVKILDGPVYAVHMQIKEEGELTKKKRQSVREQIFSVISKTLTSMYELTAGGANSSNL